MKTKQQKRKRRRPEASDLNKYSEIFFSSFNRSMQAVYDTCIDTARERVSDNFADAGSAGLQSGLEKEYEKWLSEQLPGIGKTPREYLDEAGFNEIAGMFRCGTVICDDELPAVYIEKLLSYGQKAVDFLIETTTVSLAEPNDENLVMSAMAARILGRQKTERAVLPLIDVLDGSRGISELMQEAARDALVDIGRSAVDLIIQEMSSGNRSDETCEYLVMSLAEIGKDCRSDEIYSALKNAFNTLPDKAVTANCLARYGDGRAIPALRGYLLKNGGNVSREVFYDIVSAVRQLGGRIDDLKQVPGR